MRSALATVLLPLVFTSLDATTSADPASDEVVISVSSRGGIRVPVEIDGQGPFSLMLDTGSSHSTLASELADRLELPVVAQARVVTAAGVQVQPVVSVGRVTIGGASVLSLMPSVVSLFELSQLEPGILGVIGQDFLIGFDFTVDYRQKRLRWSAEEAEAHDRVPLVRSGSRSLARLGGQRRPGTLLMVPDTGSAGFVIFTREGRTALEVDGLGATVGVSALSMQRAAGAAILRRLEVGSVTLRDQPAVVVEREDASAAEADGLMPLHAFSRVSFNNREAYLVVRR
jgi:predicted aspartyl protease